MDESFLSDEQLVAVSRDYVCIRLATYEDEVEAKYLKSIFQGRRTGELENTVFAILGSDGKEKLSKTGRSPKWAFNDVHAMASWMKNLLEDDYSAKASARYSDASLPLAKDFRRGLNVASCDQSLFIVVVGDGDTAQQELQSRLLPLAWSEEFAGDFIYAATNDAKDLEVLDDPELPNTGVLVVRPGDYGKNGIVLAKLDAESSDDELQSAMRLALEKYGPQAKDPRSHISKGMRLGIQWKTAVPATDGRTADPEYRRKRKSGR